MGGRRRHRPPDRPRPHGPSRVPRGVLSRRHAAIVALGAAFSSNPAASDERTCGTAASLAGIERARRDGDAAQLDLAVRRLLLA
ncbi:MAG: hypothetical protein R2713_03580 [Ilumatobacteraceae bacterium]